MWKKAFRSANSFTARFGGESVLMLVIGIFVALILTPLDPIKINSWLSPSITTVVLIGAIYSGIVFFTLYLLVLLVKLIEEHSVEEKHRYITRLGEDRTKGVRLRNSLLAITTREEMDGVITRYNDWDAVMLETLALFSPGESAWLRTLDRMPVAFGNFISDDHRRYVGVMNEKLRRLDMVLRKYLEIPKDEFDENCVKIY